MSLRSILADLDGAEVARVDELLERAMAEQDVWVPFTIDSRSRAWG